MKILLLAGEESGLIYANELKSLLKGVECRGYADYGFETHDLAVMGFAAVLSRLPFFLRVKRTMEKAIDEWRPDAVVTIDYPGMNLKLAAYAKTRGVKAIHIVCPQVWAWKSGRIPKIEASLDRLLCFFPFEPKLFKAGFAEFVGHPLVERFPSGLRRVPASGKAKTLALLPGSRIGEISKCLPTMLEAAAKLKDVVAVVPAANEGAKKAIVQIVARQAKIAVKVQDGGARELLLRADAAVVASGTATLEAALARCPTVLVYRVSALLAWFARRVIKGVKHIGLINVVWEKSMRPADPAKPTLAEIRDMRSPMPELLQEDFTADSVAAILENWLADESARREAVARLDRACALLGSSGGAMNRIAEVILAAARGK